MDYDDYYYCMNHNGCDLRKITKPNIIKKFIYETPIGSGKSTAFFLNHINAKFRRR